MKIIKIEVRPGDGDVLKVDLIHLHTDLPKPGSETEKLVLCFSTPAGESINYVSKHFGLEMYCILKLIPKEETRQAISDALEKPAAQSVPAKEKYPKRMMLIISEYKSGKLKEINRREIEVVKKGRWLLTQRLSFDAKTLEQTKSTGGQYHYRLEPLKGD